MNTGAESSGDVPRSRKYQSARTTRSRRSIERGVLVVLLTAIFVAPPWLVSVLHPPARPYRPSRTRALNT